MIRYWQDYLIAIYASVVHMLAPSKEIFIDITCIWKAYYSKTFISDPSKKWPASELRPSDLPPIHSSVELIVSNLWEVTTSKLQPATNKPEPKLEL